MPHPCAFMDLPFWPGVPSLQSQLQWDGGAGRGGVGNVDPWAAWISGYFLRVGGKALGFQGQVWLQQPGSSVTVGQRAAPSWGFLTPNTVTRSPHALGGSLSLDPAASCWHLTFDMSFYCGYGEGLMDIVDTALECHDFMVPSRSPTQ